MPRLSIRRGKNSYWMYGQHAVRHATANPRRTVLRVLSARGRAPSGVAAEEVAQGRLSQLLGGDAAHQGLAAETAPLVHEEESVLDAMAAEGALSVALDRVSDPRNVGAALRSAWAFGATALLAPERGSPPESGALAKTACGALEHVPYLRVGNLARALAALTERGVLTVGLDGNAETPLERVAEDLGDRPTLLVAGAEGEGLRRLTRERCDMLARISTRVDSASLNVSNACAIALHAMRAPERAEASEKRERKLP